MALTFWQGDLDLPSRLEPEVPCWFTEAMVALATIALTVGARLAIDGIAPNVVPFALTFPAITLATLLAGGRSGLITLVMSQLLVWYFIIPPAHSFALVDLTSLLNLILVTFAQGVVLWTITRYRQLVLATRRSDRRRIDSLSIALRELDHRTKNNFQIAVSLLTLQARGADDPALKAALSRAVTRLQAIASVYSNLAISSETLTATRLHDHLEEICGRLREGLLSPTVALRLEADEVVVPHDLAIRIGLIVNEQITNAAKHAFPDGMGTIRVCLDARPGQLELAIGDDGQGYAPTAGADGLGTRLVALLARQIGAEVEMHVEGGTQHRYLIPHASGEGDGKS